MGGQALVIASFLSGVLVNCIEGICSFIFSIVLFYPMKKLFKRFILTNDTLIIKETKIVKEIANYENMNE
jgi:hypothetical protein